MGDLGVITTGYLIDGKGERKDKDVGLRIHSGMS
jgi:hypothetical protein